MRLENPAQQRSLASIISGLSDDDRANIVRRLARLERLLEKQNDFDEQVAGALLSRSRCAQRTCPSACKTNQAAHQGNRNQCRLI